MYDENGKISILAGTRSGLFAKAVAGSGDGLWTLSIFAFSLELCLQST